MQNPIWWQYTTEVEKQRLADVQEQNGGNWFTNMFGTVASGINRGFDWYQKSVLKPISAIAMSGFSPKVQGAKSTDWYHQQLEEYEKWKAPWGVKRASEMILDPTNALLFVSPTLKAGQIGLNVGSKALKVGLEAGIVPKVTKGLATGIKETVAPGVKTAIGKMQVAEAIEKQSPIHPLIKELTDLVKTALPSGKEAALLKSEELSRRVGMGAKTLATGQGREAILESRKALSGMLPKATFEAPIKKWSQSEAIQKIDGLTNIYKDNPKIRFLEKQGTDEALQKVLWGTLPPKSERELLRKAFGTEFVKVLEEKLPFKSKAWQLLMDTMNIPRALITMADASASLMQGAYMAATHPQEWANRLAPQMRAFYDADYAKMIDETMRANPLFSKAADVAKVPFTELGTSVPRAMREEMYASPLAEKIPIIGKIVKASERSFVTFTNQMRFDSFKVMTQGWDEAKKTAKDYRSVGNLIGDMTGRGRLGSLQKYSDVLNISFFAPRLISSKIMLPLDVVISTPTVRRMAAKDLVTAVYQGSLVLSLAKLNGADVELDPRSTDFGKMKFGNTRVNFWGGYQPYARVITQMMTGERKTTGTGNIVDADRVATLGNFIRSKLSPQLGFATDVLKGESFTGQELLPKDQSLATSVGQQALSRLAPLFAQDVYQAVQDVGLKGISVAPAAALGMGVQTYKGLGDIEREVAAKLFPDTAYKDLLRDQLRKVKESPEVAKVLAQMQQKGMPSAQQELTAAMARYKQNNIGFELDLKTHLDAGMKGVAKREAIQELKQRRYTAYQDTVGTQVEDAIAKSGGNTKEIPIDDKLAEEYWGIELQENPATGTLDYATRDAQRQQILDQAKAQGVDPEYITGDGDNAFRAERFTDPTVRAAVEDYEQAQEVLKPYWNITDTVYKRYPQVKAVLDKIATLTANYQATGNIQYYYQAQALRDRYPIVAKVNQLIDNLKLAWRRRNYKGEKYLREYYGLAPIQIHK